MKRVTMMIFAAALLASGCATVPSATSGANLDRYRSVLIEPFSVTADLPGEDREALVGTLRAAFEAPLRDSATLASAPGPQVLRVKITVTEVNRSSPALNVLTAALLFVPLDSGGASITMELRDAQTGRLIETRTQHSKSTPLALKGSFSEYGHALAAFGRWGADLNQALSVKRTG